jgi:geranylgeranyl pyrophosphate synthase
LARIYASESLTDADVARVTALLDGCGAREAASTAARRHIDDALAALREINIDAERRADLETIAAFAVDRSA